ncbi:hypothetical protein LTR56_023938 [Elasticomyces elasticus]|nr:hypothetical protein LTR56_023938 [Elasticomyces elasticus]KAK3646382.1 hypothetical protein LTR22_014362 [Elasticomyces elasticus]KAK4910539.1 hypothetical protein LTR49_020805 [Elasticomyces elasticus]KAK5745654.1 hypothetical protein LTS12_022995 [Elasticomyces elasticus]
MSTRYTDEEWAKFITEVEKDVVVSKETYKCPDLEGPALAATIDHTLLKLDARAVQFDELCAEARVDGFATVCVRPQWVQKCVNDLKSSSVKVASVIGFHEGTYDLLHKAQETKQALHGGASELDIVLNYEELKAGNYASVYSELATLRLQAPHPVLLKLIIETSQLDRAQIIAACTMAAAAKFDFVKTSTGFNGHGATEDHVRLMAACCERLAISTNGQGKMRVKASGGIRTIEDALKMLEAGASRLGTSGGVWIVKEARETAEQTHSLSPPSVHDRRGSRPSLETRLFTDY